MLQVIFLNSKVPNIWKNIIDTRYDIVKYVCKKIFS